MGYKIGDTVIHWTHGVGSVVAIDEMSLSGLPQQYYVVEVEVLKLWVPLEEGDLGSIRLPSEGAAFQQALEILRMPGASLPERHYQRKLALRERMQKRTLVELCHVIRDLTDLSRVHPLNKDDAAVLFAAEEHLLDEWELSLGTARPIALQELETLLQ